MGWDDEGGSDDEWADVDVDAKLEAQRKEKEREKRREQGLDSESDGEEKKKAKVDEPSAPKPKPKKKEEPKKKDEPVLSAQEEKLRRRRLEEEQDARLANDLFAGVDKAKAQKEEEEQAAAKAAADEKAKKEAAKPKVVIKDSFDELELKTQADVEKLGTDCLEKITKGTCREAPKKFLVDVLKLIEGDLNLKELTDLEKVLAEIVTQKKVSKSSDAKANKANTKVSKTTKFNVNSEYEEVYGGGAGDEEWTPEEWEAWEASQKAEKK